MFCKKEFGIECEAVVSKGGAPRNNGMLKLGLGRGGRATFDEQYSFGFTNLFCECPINVDVENCSRTFTCIRP